MERVAGIEPATSSLPRKCSTTELHKQGGNRRGDRPALRKGKVGSLGELISCWIRPEIVSTTQVSLPHAFSHCVADCISPPPSVKRILGKNFRGFCPFRHPLIFVVGKCWRGEIISGDAVPKPVLRGPVRPIRWRLAQEREQGNHGFLLQSQRCYECSGMLCQWLPPP